MMEDYTEELLDLYVEDYDDDEVFDDPTEM